MALTPFVTAHATTAKAQKDKLVHEAGPHCVIHDIKPNGSEDDSLNQILAAHAAGFENLELCIRRFDNSPV